MGMRGSGGMEGGVGGEIVEVPGGHIVRATGRKDRHSKVYTSKGPRDRRVRLSAHTAIQFYDVQDRLGYDRPSKAVDWLINKAKSAIEKLSAETVQPSEPSRELANYPQAIASSTHHEQEPESSEYGFQINRQIESFDTMRSCNSGLNFGGYKNDVIPRAANPDQQYLGLSLLPFQGNTTNPNFAGSSGTAASYDANYQRFSGWTGDLAAETRGFMVNSHTQTPMAWLGQQALMLPPPEPAPAPALLRGPLQSSFGQSFRAWGADQISTVDHLGDKSNSISLHPSSNFGIIQGFAVDGDPSSSSSSPPHSNQ